jgi:hypothetical protein
VLVFAALILTAVLSVRTLTGLVSAENAVTQDLVIEKVLQNLMSQARRGQWVSRTKTLLFCVSAHCFSARTLSKRQQVYDRR